MPDDFPLRSHSSSSLTIEIFMQGKSPGLLDDADFTERLAGVLLRGALHGHADLGAGVSVEYLAIGNQ